MAREPASTLSVQAAAPGLDPAAQRLLFIDMFRGLATLVMIEGHVTNTTMLRSIRASKEFHYVDLFNGFIAPSFIFIAGFAFMLALQKKWDAFRSFDKTFWLQIRRLIFILAVGYWLHMPTWSLRSLLQLNAESIYYFLRCDVLHLIVFSLLFTLLLAVSIRRKQIFSVALLLIALGIIFTAPFIHDVNPRRFFPAPVSDYFNDKHYALFPIFPWSAYALLGTFVCGIYVQAREKGKQRLFFRTLFILGFLLLAGGFALFYLPWQYHTYADPSRSSPRSFMFKLGFVLMSLSALWFYEQKKRPQKSYLNMVGQESLLVYGLHLVLVYGAAFMPTSIAKAVGPVLSYWPSFTISILLIAVMCVVAVLWHLLKQRSPGVARAVFYSLCFIYFVRFLIY